MRQTLLIGSYLHEDLVAKIANQVPEVEIINRPDLLPKPQFACDHVGVKRKLSGDQLAQWRECLSRADVMFDFDWWEPNQWAEHSPRLRWIQASQAGVGTKAVSLGHSDGRVQITTAAGIHAKPLAEFALAGLLHFVRQIPELEKRKKDQAWSTGGSHTLYGQRALIIGAGSIGKEMAKTLDFFGVECHGTNRTGKKLGAPFRKVMPLEHSELGIYDIVVLSCPLTEATRGLFTRGKFAAMKDRSIFVNLARGPVIDQVALIESLETGKLAGAVLDVADPEPLPTGHDLWEAPNLIISPHTAANVDVENARLVEFFVTNLRRYLAGESLINTYDPTAGY